MIERLGTILDQIPGWLSAEEGALLFKLASDLCRKGRVVEIGAYQGRSTICLALGIRESGAVATRLLSVDTHKGSSEHQLGRWAFSSETVDKATGRIDTLPLLKANLERFDLTEMVEIQCSDSQAASKLFTEKISLLFIDGCHSLEGIRKDVLFWCPYLLTDAVVVLHDVGEWPGPTQVAAELLWRGYKRITQSGSALALKPPPTTA